MQRDDVVFRDLGTIEPQIKQYNDALENKLNQKIIQEKYYMHIPLPVTYKREAKTKALNICQDYDKYYEMFYFGQKAANITSAQELSTFRGTFLNLQSLSGVNISTPSVATKTTSNNLKSKSNAYSFMNTLSSYLSEPDPTTPAAADTPQKKSSQWNN
jgi:hypothetical protein